MRHPLLRLSALILTITAAASAQPGGGPPGGGSGDGIWRRNAYYGELLTFDSCVGHQPGGGSYHYHADPLCLRAQLNDNLQTLRTSRNGSVYAELASGWHHSPILGWAPDGNPIYGPYGYTDPANASSAIKRIKPGFRLRAITQRHTLPDWAVPNHPAASQTLTTAQYGPDVSEKFPLGRYVEDYEWAAGVGDLDQYNGRTTVTPEFPNGTYAYYVTIDDNGTPVFPYVIAGQYYGTVGGGFTNNVTTSASDYFNAGTFTAGAPSAAAFNSWSTQFSKQFAKVVSGFDPSAGPSTTWNGVSTPALAETQRIRYTDTSVYVTSNGVAGHNMGPWFSADMASGVFNSVPNANSTTFSMPRASASATTHSNTGMGSQGMWVNGVVLFNFLDGASFVNSTGADSNAGNLPAYDAAVASAASLEQGPLAPGSIVSAFPLFFSVLATSTASATSPSWPATLGGTTISVRDSTGTSMMATIAYASPGQLNFLLPTGLASGAGTVTITAGTQTITSKINIQPVYPNLFTLNSNALAAASITRVRNGANNSEQIYAVQNGNLVASPIALNGDQVYLVIYGSGLGSATSATATIGGVAATVAYAGPQGTYSGLDQYNILIPASLSGKGKVDVVVTAGGKVSNPVNVTIQ